MQNFVKAAGKGDYLVREKSDGKSFVLVVNAGKGQVSLAAPQPCSPVAPQPLSLLAS